MPLLAQADSVKWTDLGTFWTTAVQAAVVIIALVAACVRAFMASYEIAVRSRDPVTCVIAEG